MGNSPARAVGPRPYGPTPDARQRRWHELECYGFLHFTVNTFTDKEWGYGDESPGIFSPTDFDADQIVEAVHDAGLRALILTCKHHDGFCLWPSHFTEHSVANSPWRKGQGDIVREVSEACQKRGLRFGVYLSPWDRNHPAYAYPEYVTYYRNQLRELLQDYGPVFEVWFDGANGGDGYYGGARERREIDRATYYDWGRTWQIVRELQPDACIFSDAGPDVRWVGNERGIAGETCWATLDREDFVPGFADQGRLNSGDRSGRHWLPAECDVSIRPGWFYHPAEDQQVRSPQNLLDLYFQSVGRGASLLLNIPPDRRGRLHENDISALRGLRKLLDQTFASDLAKTARTATAAQWQGNPRCGARGAIDGRQDTYWYPGDDVPSPELVLSFDHPVRFSIVGLREYLLLGQRVDAFAVDIWQNGLWNEIAAGTSIGSRRLVRTPCVETTQVRLRVTRAPVGPALSEFSLWNP